MTTWRDKTRRFVLKSQDRLPFRLIYKFYYGLALALFRLSCRLRFPRIEVMELRRGLAQGLCVPGASDIDLRIVVRPEDIEGETAFLKAFWRHYAAVKKAFPILGEIQVLDSRLAPMVRTLGGLRERAADAAAVSPLRHRWECISESISSCLFLLEQTYFSSSGSAAEADFGFKIVKGYLDTLRHAAASRSMDRARVPERRDFLNDMPDTTLKRTLADPRRLDRDQALDICCGSLQALDAACGDFIAQTRQEDLWSQDPPTAPIPWDASTAANADLFIWRSRVKALERASLPRVHGLYFDSMFRWYALADVHDRFALKRLVFELEQMHRQDSLFGAPPLVCSRNIFQALLWTSHLDTPFFYYSLSPRLSPLGVAARPSGASSLLGWGQRAQWKMTASDFSPPPRLLLDFSLGQSLADLALSLRLFGLESWAGDNAYRACLLYSRLLSAHLYLEKKIVSDPADLDRLVSLHEEHCPELFARIEAPLRETLNRSADEWNQLPAEESFYRHYPSYSLLLDRLFALIAG